MRHVVLIFCAAPFFCGCSLLSPKTGEPASNSAEPAPIIRLADNNIGQVAKANGEFAVLTFPLGRVPQIGQKLNVYRSGKKVGELKVTGPQRGINTVADVISGEAQENDEVRAD